MVTHGHSWLLMVCNPFKMFTSYEAIFNAHLDLANVCVVTLFSTCAISPLPSHVLPPHVLLILPFSSKIHKFAYKLRFFRHFARCKHMQQLHIRYLFWCKQQRKKLHLQFLFLSQQLDELPVRPWTTSTRPGVNDHHGGAPCTAPVPTSCWQWFADLPLVHGMCQCKSDTMANLHNGIFKSSQFR